MTQHKSSGASLKKQRIERAAEYQTRHLSMTPKKQLNKLDKLGERAKKERARLNQLIEAGLGDKTFEEISEMRRRDRLAAEQEAAKQRAEAEKQRAEATAADPTADEVGAKEG
jgi:hypothetical protein